MRKVTTHILFALALILTPAAVHADTQMKTIVLEAHDGDRIHGYIYQNSKVEKNAPIALLMHGLTGASLHWIADGFPMYGGNLTDSLIEKGYRVVAIDARAHGARKNDMSPYARVKAARKGEPGSYKSMIENTIDDYNTLIADLQREFPEAEHLVAIGYSMGAQMAVLLSAENPAVTHLVTMVPPFVENVPAVAPINHAADVKVPWLLMTANKDQFSTPEENARLVAKISSPLDHKSFDSGHVLPVEYLTVVTSWIADIAN